MYEPWHKDLSSVHVVKVLRDPESFINVVVIKGKLLLCPWLDGKNIIWKHKSKSLLSELKYTALV